MFLFRTVGLLAGIAIFRGLSLPGRLPLEPSRPPLQETRASPLPAMFKPRSDSRVCTAWLTCLVRIAHRGSGVENCRLRRLGMTEGFDERLVV